jgi:DGQHR domain-containing protein
MAIKKHQKSNYSLPSFAVVSGKCLGYSAYRGFGPLSEIASLSTADIFDQDKNRSGTQRNLNVGHARRAYQYVQNTEKAFYPEMILNVRDKSYVEFDPIKTVGETTFGSFRFLKNPKQAGKVIVSRLDGNHRLWFVDGHEKTMEAISRLVSFCILVVEDLESELEIFRDVNDNQMGMNTSHLQNIQARLLGNKTLKIKDPAAYIVQKLIKSPTSPLRGRVHEGGVVEKNSTLAGLTIANLTSSVRDMLSRSTKLAQFADADAQYKVVENFWAAVKQWLPKAWNTPKEYLIFKGVGLYAISYVGIEVIDRSLAKGKFSANDMLKYLQQMPPESLLSGGTLPYAGRGGGRKMANDLIANLTDDGQISLTALQKLILSN